MSDVRYPHFPDGLAADITDMNAMRDFARSLEGDMRLGTMLARATGGGQTLDKFKLYSSGIGGAPTLSGTNLRVENTGGMIHQYLSNTFPDGATPNLLSYWLIDNELMTVLGAGDGSNPRIDLIEIKLDIEDETETRDVMDASGIATSTAGVLTRKRTRLTKNVVVGTPGASPTAPSPTAGYVPWAYVWVPTSFASTFTAFEVSDFRFPLGYQRVLVPAIGLQPHSSLAHWPMTLSAWATRAAGGAAEVLAVRCPIHDGNSKLLSVIIDVDDPVDLDLYAVPVGGGSGVNVFTKAATQGFDHTEFSLAPAATRPMALWCNGKGHADIRYTLGQNYLYLTITSLGATDIRGVSFEVAGNGC